MTDMLVTGLDEATVARLKARAEQRSMSVEALAREALNKAAQLTMDEKLAIVHQMQEWSRRARVPGVRQTPGLELIREGRDLDH